MGDRMNRRSFLGSATTFSLASAAGPVDASARSEPKPLPANNVICKRQRHDVKITSYGTAYFVELDGVRLRGVQRVAFEVEAAFPRRPLVQITLRPSSID